MNRYSNRYYDNNYKICKNEKETNSHQNCSFDDMNFIDNLRIYIGELVTIFTVDGGNTEHGFSGFLMEVNGYFIRLETKIGTGPACFIENFSDSDNSQENYYDIYSRNDKYNNEENCNCQCLVDIPIDKIAAFVHNKSHNFRR